MKSDNFSKLSEAINCIQLTKVCPKGPQEGHCGSSTSETVTCLHHVMLSACSSRQHLCLSMFGVPIYPLGAF